MSKYTGKLIRLPLYTDIESMCKAICNNDGVCHKDGYPSWQSRFKDYYRKKYIIIGDLIYKIECTKEDCYEVFSGKYTTPSEIEFDIVYDSDNRSFDDAIRMVMENLC